MEQRLERLEDRVGRIEDEVKKQALEFAETRVYVKEIYKNMHDIQVAIESLKARAGSEWRGFVDKAFWLVAGGVVTYVVTKIHF